MTSTTCEIVWLRRSLAYIGIFLHRPTPLYCDSKSVIQIARYSVFHEWIKHIEINYHVTRHHYKLGTILLPFVSSYIQIAEMFIQALPLRIFVPYLANP